MRRPAPLGYLSSWVTEDEAGAAEAVEVAGAAVVAGELGRRTEQLRCLPAPAVVPVVM